MAGCSYDKAGNRTVVHRDNVTEEYLYEKNRLLEHRIKEHDSQKNGALITFIYSEDSVISEEDTRVALRQKRIKDFKMLQRLKLNKLR